MMNSSNQVIPVNIAFVVLLVFILYVRFLDDGDVDIFCVAGALIYTHF